ncbi:MAG: glutaminyl-peptide cyclotransferase [Sphingobacterium sp.]
MNNRIGIKIGVWMVLPFLFLAGCKTQKGKIEFTNPTHNSRVLKGEKLAVRLSFPSPDVDSVVYSIDGNIFDRKTDTSSVVLDSEAYSFGSKRLSAKVYAEGKEDIAYSEVLFVPPAAKPYSFEVINTFDHDPKAFTQGLYYEDGELFESTGREGESTVRRVELETGKVLQKVDMAANEFGEGMTVVGDEAYVLTWQNNKGHVYDKNSFKLLRSFDYQNSKLGWGLTYDGDRFIKSDGTAILYFLDAENLKETGSVHVFDENGPVENLNELEFIDGKVYANLYYGDRDEVVIIDPQTGVVEGKINFVGLYDGKRASFDTEMNGIAYKPETETLLVTGKLWTKLYEVRLKER